jgi:hypothetical protein
MCECFLRETKQQVNLSLARLPARLPVCQLLLMTGRTCIMRLFRWVLVAAMSIIICAVTPPPCTL